VYLAAGDDKPAFFVASRGHHADVGGTTPGSMPPFSRSIGEEGVLIDNFKLVENGEMREAELLALLRRAWRLPWDNDRKELLWRLTLNGVPNAQHMHLLGEPCTCGVAGPGRRHHYWECPVAQAVVAAIQQRLPQPAQLQCVHVWLARPPHRTLHKGVWLVVCMAALLAMDHGRKRLCAWALPPRPDRPPPRVPPHGQEVAVASKAAVAFFWAMLADFAGMRTCPPEWLPAISTTHPFLATHAGGQDGECALRVSRGPLG